MPRLTHQLRRLRRCPLRLKTRRAESRILATRHPTFAQRLQIRRAVRRLGAAATTAGITMRAMSDAFARLTVASKFAGFSLDFSLAHEKGTANGA